MVNVNIWIFDPFKKRKKKKEEHVLIYGPLILLMEWLIHEKEKKIYNHENNHLNLFRTIKVGSLNFYEIYHMRI